MKATKRMRESAYLKWRKNNDLEPDRFALTVYTMSDDWKKDFLVWAKKNKNNKRWQFLRDQLFSHLDYRTQQGIDQDREKQAGLKKKGAHP